MRLLKKTLVYLTRNDQVWALFRPLSLIGCYLDRSRKSYMREVNKRRESKLDIFIDQFKLEVQNGPFKGLKYPSVASFGSTIYPKIIGSYEKELSETIEGMKAIEYSSILDIGCAEGYYAIGLAVSNPKTVVYAYDISEKARKMCKKMALNNDVADRVIIRAECTPKELETFPFTGKTLIICDCEGYEKELFTSRNVQNLKNCDLIIETHDFIDINISTYIKDTFSKTHTIDVIKSIDDIEKALTYNFKGLENFDLSDRRKAYRESRPTIMEWVICRSKSSFN